VLRPVCAPPLCKNTNLFGTLSFVRCFFLTFVPLNPCLGTETLKTVTHESQTKWPFLSVGSEFSSFFFGAVLLALNLCFTACIDEEKPNVGKERTESVGVGKKIPQFSVKMSDKSTFSSQFLSGHRAIVVFFYSGCGDCHRYLPTLNRFYEGLRADPEGEFRDVRLICISRADRADRIAQYWADAHFSLPYAPESDRRVYDLFGAHRVPTTYVFDAQGVCVATYGDSNAPDESELRNALRKAK